VRITEQQMFRAVLVVALAMVPVIALAAVVDPLAGAILLAVELAVAAGYLWQRWRASRVRPES
jgi:membrane protein implicated in regulation of membrane protease activity